MYYHSFVVLGKQVNKNVCLSPVTTVMCQFNLKIKYTITSDIRNNKFSLLQIMLLKIILIYEKKIY